MQVRRLHEKERGKRVGPHVALETVQFYSTLHRYVQSQSYAARVFGAPHVGVQATPFTQWVQTRKDASRVRFRARLLVTS